MKGQRTLLIPWLLFKERPSYTLCFQISINHLLPAHHNSKLFEWPFERQLKVQVRLKKLHSVLVMDRLHINESDLTIAKFYYLEVMIRLTSSAVFTTS